MKKARKDLDVQTGFVESLGVISSTLVENVNM